MWRNPRKSLVKRVEPLKKEFKMFTKGELSYSLVLYVDAKLAQYGRSNSSGTYSMCWFKGTVKTENGMSALTLAGKFTALRLRLPMPFFSHERLRVTTSRYKDSDFQSLCVIRKKKKL